MNPREHLFDFYRSIFMLFVFFHHTYLAWPNTIDVTNIFNPFAELFVGLSGFMVGYVYLHRTDYSPLLYRGIIILIVYYSVSIPSSIGAAVIIHNQSVINALIKCLLLQEDHTFIGILRFYGLIFLILPILLVYYKQSKRLFVYTSFLIFIISTLLYHSYLYIFDNFFIKHMILLLFQSQMFFVIGLFIGDKYRNKLLPQKSLIIFSSILIVLGITLNFLVYDTMILNKSPYTFGKFINLLWSAPIMLIVFYQMYKYLKSGWFDSIVRVVGRNSLVAFVVSEFVMKLIRLFLEINRHKLKWLIPPWFPLVSGIAAVIIITTIMWVYEKHAKAYVGLSRWGR